MRRSKATAARLKPAILAWLGMLAVAGCGTINLGDIDETEAERDDMPGPGIFADEDGETRLKWVVDTDNRSTQAAAPVVSEQDKSQIETEAVAAKATPMDEKAEFEAFKKWDRMRTEGANSPEYQEFLLWLEYQRFKN